MKMLSSSIILSVLVILGYTQAQQTPIHPKLVFIRGTNNESVYTINFKEVNDTVLHDAMFLPAVQTATTICSVGIWRFYPEPDYSKDPDDADNFGLQIGFTEKPHCLTVEEVNAIRHSLTGMRSYRYLGPEDLNQFSISLYEGDHATGTEKTWTLTEFHFEETLPAPAESYLLTGIRDESISNQNRTVPTVKVFWGQNGDPDANKVCLALVNEDGSSRPKIYYRETLTPVGDEPSEPGDQVVWGSFLFLRYSTALTPGFCEEDDNSLGMIHLGN